MDIWGILALIAVITFIVIMKIVVRQLCFDGLLYFFVICIPLKVCSCLLRLRQEREEDTVSILEEDLMERLGEIHETRRQARRNRRRAREPPPTFEDALVNSRPISYIDIEEAPPTYHEYMNSSSSSETTNNNSPVRHTYLDFSPSVNPTDIVIPMEVSRITITTRENGRDDSRFESNA